MSGTERPFGITLLSGIFGIYGVLLTIPVPVGVYAFSLIIFEGTFEAIMASIEELTVAAGIFIAIGIYALLLYASSYGLWKLRPWGLFAGLSVLIVGMVVDIGVLLGWFRVIGDLLNGTIQTESMSESAPFSMALKAVPMWYLYSRKEIFE